MRLYDDPWAATATLEQLIAPKLIVTTAFAAGVLARQGITNGTVDGLVGLWVCGCGGEGSEQ